LQDLELLNKINRGAEQLTSNKLKSLSFIRESDIKSILKNEEEINFIP
jgi:hypothetical protein